MLQCLLLARSPLKVRSPTTGHLIPHTPPSRADSMCRACTLLLRSLPLLLFLAFMPVLYIHLLPSAGLDDEGIVVMVGVHLWYYYATNCATVCPAAVLSHILLRGPTFCGCDFCCVGGVREGGFLPNC